MHIWQEIWEMIYLYISCAKDILLFALVFWRIGHIRICLEKCRIFEFTVMMTD